MSGGERGQRGKETSSSKVGGAAASGAGSTMLHFIDVVKQYPGQEQVDLRVEIPCAISHNARIHAGHVYVAMLRAMRTPRTRRRGSRGPGIGGFLGSMSAICMRSCSPQASPGAARLRVAPEWSPWCMGS